MRSDLKQACGSSSVVSPDNVGGYILEEVAMLVLPCPVGAVDVQVDTLQGAQAVGINGEVLLCVGVCERLLNGH